MIFTSNGKTLDTLLVIGATITTSDTSLPISLDTIRSGRVFLV